MKEGWVTKKLGEVVDTQYGLSVPMNTESNGYKIFRMGELQNGKLYDSGAMKYADIAHDEFVKYQLRQGDVLFNRTNSLELVGKTGIFNLYGEYCFASYLIRLLPKNGKVLGTFLNYLMNSDSFQFSIKQKASKSINQANINATILSNEYIFFPISTIEQQRIVSILDAAFADISIAKANAEKNLANAKELFEAELNRIIEQSKNIYDNKPLGVCSKFIDYRGKTPNKTNDGLRLITAKNVKKGYIQRYPEEYVSPSIYSKWMTRGIPQYGDVLFTTEAPLANVAQLDTDERVVFAQRIIILHGDSKLIDNTFLKYTLLSNSLQTEIYRHGTGATATGIKSKLLKAIPIPLPPLGEQCRLVARLDEFSDNCKKLESIYTQKIALYDKLKQSLLQRAFSGEL